MFGAGISNFRDIYRCPYCLGWVGEGDKFCKKCGANFTQEDVEVMIENHRLLSKKNFPSLAKGMLLALSLLVFIMLMGKYL